MADKAKNIELRHFFDERGANISWKPNFEELCYISGREPRLWVDRSVFEDLIETIRIQLDLNLDINLLEVGCAAGFLALGLAPLCRQYTGIDMAKRSIKAAQRLQINNAKFQDADGTKLPFPDQSFDRAVCYDVFTNFPDFSIGGLIIREMLRVVTHGGKVMIGSLPDEARREEFLEACQKIGQRIEEKYGPPKSPDGKPKFMDRIRSWYIRKVQKVVPGLSCYYFRKNDFLALGNELGVKTEFLPVQRLNPYHEYRFNVVYSKGF